MLIKTDFLAIILGRGGGGNGMGAGSLSDWSGLKTVRRAIAGATGIGDKWGQWGVTEEFVRFSADKVAG